MLKRCLALSAVTLFPSLTRADDLPDFYASATPYARYSFESDLNDTNAFSVLRTGVSLAMGKSISKSTMLSLAGELEYSNYDSDADFPDDFIMVDLRPSVSTYLNEDLSVYGGAILGFGGEPDADFADSLTYGGFVGFNYQIADGVWVGTGVGVTTQLEDGLLVVPLVTLDWSITDRLSLTANGLSAKLAYELDKQWSVFVDGRYEFRQFRLSDNAIVPEGVLSDESVPVTLGVSYKPNDQVTVSLAGGAVVWREVRFFDDDENELSSDSADVTPYVAASVKIAW